MKNEKIVIIPREKKRGRETRLSRLQRVAENAAATINCRAGLPSFMNIDEEQAAGRGNLFFLDFSLSGESSDVSRLVALVARTFPRRNAQIHCYCWHISAARFMEIRITYFYIFMGLCKKKKKIKK